MQMLQNALCLREGKSLQVTHGQQRILCVRNVRHVWTAGPSSCMGDLQTPPCGARGLFSIHHTWVHWVKHLQEALFPLQATVFVLVLLDGGKGASLWKGLVVVGLGMDISAASLRFWRKVS